jgi:hypothetical protein
VTLFSYRAINDDSKEVRGQVEALDLDGAKHALEDLHLDVVEVYEATRTHGRTAEASGPQPVLQTTFAFEGTDQTGVVRRGTIRAETKYQAFERLKQDQKLMLTMLSPLGVTPQYRDNDLDNWQKKGCTATPVQRSVSALPLLSVPPLQPLPLGQKAAITPVPPKPIGFTLPEPPKPHIPPAASAPIPPRSYHPLFATLRLYAGWLLAWYGLFVAIGYYATVRMFSFDIPFIQGFFVSPLIFSFIVAIFLFLMLGTVQRAIHGTMISGMVLSILGIAGFVGVRWSL